MNAAEHFQANKLQGNPLICPPPGKAGVTFSSNLWFEVEKRKGMRHWAKQTAYQVV